MSRQEIDAYLAQLEEPKHGTLERLRQTIRGILPDSEEGIAYGSPAFRLHGSVIARVRGVQEPPQLLAPQRFRARPAAR